MTETENNETVKTETETPQIAYDVTFVAVMPVPVQNTGRFFQPEGTAKEDALQNFLEYLRNEAGIEDAKILAFDLVPAGQETAGMTELQTAETPTQAIN